MRGQRLYRQLKTQGMDDLEQRIESARTHGACYQSPGDICHGNQIANRAIMMQKKTHRPVQFEITPTPRENVEALIRQIDFQPYAL